MNRFFLDFGKKNADNAPSEIKPVKSSKFFNDTSDYNNEIPKKVVSDGTMVFSVDTNDEPQQLIIPCKNRFTKSNINLDSSISNKIDQPKPLDLPEDEIARQVVLDALKYDDLFEYKQEQAVVPPILVKNKSTIGEDQTDYTNVPVESFGLAMLMGMGYDPNKPTNASSPDALLNKRRIYDKAGLGSHNTLLKITNHPSNPDNRESKPTAVSASLADENGIWVSKGLVVKVIDRKDEYYKNKGDVAGVDGDFVTVKFGDGMKKGYKIKYLETVVKEGEDAKVVLPTLHPINSSQLLGRLVKVVKRGDVSATVEMLGKTFKLPLDNICYFHYMR